MIRVQYKFDSFYLGTIATKWLKIRPEAGVSLFLETSRTSRENKGGRSEKYESVGIMWTSDDARLPGQFVIMTGTADRVLTTRNDSSSAGVKPRISQFVPCVRSSKFVITTLYPFSSH